MIASPPATSSCLASPFSCCPTRLIGCPRTQHPCLMKALFFSFCKTYTLASLHNAPKCPFREDVVLHDVAYKLHIVSTFLPFFGCRIDFLPSRHPLVSVHLLEIGNPSQWTLSRLAFCQNCIICASRHCLEDSRHWCVQGHLEVSAKEHHFFTVYYQLGFRFSFPCRLIVWAFHSSVGCDRTVVLWQQAESLACSQMVQSQDKRFIARITGRIAF